MITVFTPTYNRGYIIPELYKSLQRQTCYDFEWLVIDDGSSDDTEEMFKQWTKAPNPFTIRYIKVKNNGKQRAINQALQLAEGEYFFIVDSDDILLSQSIKFVYEAFQNLPDQEHYIGIAGIRGRFDTHEPLKRIPIFESSLAYIDANNLERLKYGLDADMAEIFYTEKLKKYVFPVWKGEKFTPEAVVWDQIALDGYKLRWHNKVIYLCEYRDDGLTKSSWNLLKNNPMGYAMLFNTQLKYKKGNLTRINLALQFISCCCLAKQYSYISHSVMKPYIYLLFPIGWILSIRRKKQFLKYIK